MRKLYTRRKYLGIEKDTHKLSYGTSAILPGEFKNLKKRLINPSPSNGTVKETDRDEREFKAPGKRNFSTSPAINSSISSSRMF
jgi:hypothetical protein